VLSPERRQLRAHLSVRAALVETRAHYITTIRGLARAAGVLLPTCAPSSFVSKIEEWTLDGATRALVAPLLATLKTLETELEPVEKTLSEIAEKDPAMQLCATVPGVGLIVAATFVSVVDEAKRFHNAHAVGAYLGLVPAESTTGGPNKRRLGSITKQGNRVARAMLIQAAWTIYRLRDENDPLKRWVTHVAKTRNKHVAVVGLARKLSGVLWAIWRDGAVYDPKQHAEKAARGVEVAAGRQLDRAKALQRSATKLRRPLKAKTKVSALTTPRKTSKRSAM
jgi:transposase